MKILTGGRVVCPACGQVGTVYLVSGVEPNVAALVEIVHRDQPGSLPHVITGEQLDLITAAPGLDDTGI